MNSVTDKNIINTDKKRFPKDEFLVNNDPPTRKTLGVFKHSHSDIDVKIVNTDYQKDSFSSKISINKVLFECGDGKKVELITHSLQDLGMNIEKLKEDLFIKFKKTFGDLGLKVYLGFHFEADKQSNDGSGFINIGRFIEDLLGYKQANHKIRTIVNQIINFLENVNIKLITSKNKYINIKLFTVWASESDKPMFDDIKPVEYFILGRLRSKIYFQLNPELFKRGKIPYLLIDKRFLQIDLNKHPYIQSIILHILQQFRMNPKVVRKTKWLFDYLGLSVKENVLRSYNRLKSEIEYIKAEKNYIQDFSVNEKDSNRPTDILERTWTFYPSVVIRERMDNIDKKRISYQTSDKKIAILNGKDIEMLMIENNLSLNEFANQIGYSKGNLSKIINSKNMLSKNLVSKIQNWNSNKKNKKDV